MNRTENLGLTLYEVTDKFRITNESDSLNHDMEIIDDAVHTLQVSDETNAKVDGYYQAMTVGDAEQLVSTVGVEDKVPYLFRTSGGSADIGDREVDKVVGGTVAWNQLVSSPTDVSLAVKALSNGSRIISGHKYLFDYECSIADTSLATVIYLYVKQNGESLVTGAPIISLDSGNKTCIWNATCNAVADGNANSDNGAWIYNSRISNTTPKSFNVFDLTQMFGPTIADYIYTLETSTPGSGVAWFKSLFNAPFCAYNAGELMSVKTTAHNMTGLNQWDEQWEVGEISTTDGENTSGSGIIRSKNYIPVLPSTIYYFKTGETAINTYRHFYDANKNYLGYVLANTNSVLTIPANARYMRFRLGTAYGSTYNNDICINLHWDGERDGEYEPYDLHSYPLDDVELRGIPKLDANNALYYDGDTYESDGTVTRKYGIIDLGTLDYTYNSTYTMFLGTIVGMSSSSSKRAVCSNYQCVSDWVNSDFWSNGNMLITMGGTDNYIRIKNTAYTDSNLFKASLDGVYLVYELAEPTTESADPYQNPQYVNDWGTEEYVDTRTIPIPVGHETTYRPNLRAKLEMAPNSPSGDGDYLVRQSSGINTYVPITFPADELPAAPTTDGTYTLKCTVSDGTATFTWES